MTPERFDAFIEDQRERFSVEGEGTEALTDAPTASKRWVIFSTPAGRLKLELHERPVMVDQRAVGGKRVGAGARVETRFDLSQHTHTLHAFKEGEDGEWEEVEAPV